MKTSRFLRAVSTVVCGVSSAVLAANSQAQTIPKGNLVVDLETFAALTAGATRPNDRNVWPNGRDVLQ